MVVCAVAAPWISIVIFVCLTISDCEYLESITTIIEQLLTEMQKWVLKPYEEQIKGLRTKERVNFLEFFKVLFWGC